MGLFDRVALLAFSKREIRRVENHLANVQLTHHRHEAIDQSHARDRHDIQASVVPAYVFRVREGEKGRYGKNTANSLPTRDAEHFDDSRGSAKRLHNCRDDACRRKHLPRRRGCRPRARQTNDRPVRSPDETVSPIHLRSTHPVSVLIVPPVGIGIYRKNVVVTKLPHCCSRGHRRHHMEHRQDIAQHLKASNTPSVHSRDHSLACDFFDGLRRTTECYIQCQSYSRILHRCECRSGRRLRAKRIRSSTDRDPFPAKFVPYTTF